MTGTRTLFWRPRVALFVNAQTLRPVLVPLAQATSVVWRLPVALGDLARRLGVGRWPLDREVAGMAEHVLAKGAAVDHGLGAVEALGDEALRRNAPDAGLDVDLDVAQYESQVEWRS